MKTWYVTGAVAGSKYLGKVQANTLEDAEKLAQELPTLGISLCHRCREQCEDAEITEFSLVEE